jgi:hypothetical protein
MAYDNDEARLARRMTAVACACLIALSGCATPATPRATTNPPTAAPVFESDEEALAAATEAYANYQQMADLIDNEGGLKPERIAPFVSERFLDTAIQQSEGFRERNLRSVGATTFMVDGVQSLNLTDSNDTVVSLYICDDVSGVDVLDEEGTSLVSENRVAVTPFQVTFALNAGNEFVVDARDVWEGENFC